MTELQQRCAWCLRDLDVVDGEGIEGVSYGMCAECDALVRAGAWDNCPFRTQPVIEYLGRFVTPELISCPTCGRTHLRDEQTGDTAPFFAWVEKVDEAIRVLRRPLSVAVMGCEVNGPGEARQADVGIAIGKGRAALFKHGQVLRTVPLERALDELLEEIDRTW